MHYQNQSMIDQAPMSGGNASSPAARQQPSYNYQEYQYGQGGYDYPDQTAPAGPNWTSGWFTFSDPCYLKGFLLGAGAALILSNTAVQKTLIKGVVKLWSGVEYGLEEVKEQIKDLKAETDGDKEGGS